MMRTTIAGVVAVGVLLLGACDGAVGPSSCEIGRYWHAAAEKCYPQGPTCGEGFVIDPLGGGGCIPLRIAVPR